VDYVKEERSRRRDPARDRCWGVLFFLTKPPPPPFFPRRKPLVNRNKYRHRSSSAMGLRSALEAFSYPSSFSPSFESFPSLIADMGEGGLER